MQVGAPRNRCVGIELLHQPVGALLELLAVVRRPPIDPVALTIELAALVVECVGELVPDHRTDTAVVERRIALGVVEGRLQDRGGNGDAVLGGVVLRVDRLRCHSPQRPIGRMPDLGHVEVVVELQRRGPVGIEVVAGQLELREVPFLAGEAHLEDQLVPLTFCGQFGLRAHPVDGLDPLTQRLLDIAHHLGGRALRAIAEHAIDVQLPQRRPHQRVDFLQPLLPTLFLRGGSGERRLVFESVVAESLRQGVGRSVYRVKCQI